MNQQQPPQSPALEQRLNEMAEQMRLVQQQNQQLRGIIDHMAAQQRQPQPPPQAPEPEGPSAFTPEVESALRGMFKKEFDKFHKTAVEPIVQKTGQFTNYIAERNDLLEFQLRYRSDTYDKYKDKIENLRTQRAQAGYPITREEAFKLIRYEETDKKPQQNPAPAQPQGPAYDPYLQRVVSPQAGESVMQHQSYHQDPANQQPPAQQQPQQNYQQQVQQNPHQTQQIPVQNQGDDFNLPPAVMNQGVKASPQAPISGLTLDTDAKALAAWEQKYGDVPL